MRTPGSSGIWFQPFNFSVFCFIELSKQHILNKNSEQRVQIALLL
jgi:hypothetical protein